MRFENIQVYNFEGAFRGMRNPMNSWDKSDSWFGIMNIWGNPESLDEVATAWTSAKFPDWLENEDIDMPAQIYFEKTINWLLSQGTLAAGPEETYLTAFIGPNDMELAQRLIKSGPEHRKFMRQIFVTMNITAPLYWQIICQ